MSKPLRVLQVIDSLSPGGSEKIAVQIANALVNKVELSALVCTRKSGALKNELSDGVLSYTAYKKNTYDLKAFLSLRSFIKSNRINIIHAHSTSFFWGTLLKLFCPKVKLIWHDHYGMSDQLEDRNKLLIKLSSNFFDRVIAVNDNLKKWAVKHLNCSSVIYLPNFTLDHLEKDSSSLLKLKGKTDVFKLIHVANLRPQKDHLTALKAIQILINQNYNITYHMIGEYNAKSEYFQSIKSYIENNNLERDVFLYGSLSDITQILKQADLGLLSSFSEGLPVSLLEYIKAELPVVVTDVGQCKAVVGELGQVIQPKNETQLAQAVAQVIENKENSIIKALKLKHMISQNFDSSKIIRHLIHIYNLSLQNIN